MFIHAQTAFSENGKMEKENVDTQMIPSVTVRAALQDDLIVDGPSVRHGGTNNCATVREKHTDIDRNANISS